MRKYIALALVMSMQAPVLADMIADPAGMVHVKKTQIDLTSHLRKKYEGYKVSITSDYPGTLHLDSSEVENAVPGRTAAIDTRTSWANILWGLPGFWIGFGIAALIIHNKNEHAETESLQYKTELKDNELTQGSTISVKVLVPEGEQPKLKLHFTGDGVNFQKVAMLTR